MTSEEFAKLIPGKSVIKTVNENGESKELLFKFFVCDQDDYQGYYMCCTEDMSNPEPHKITDTDIFTYANISELIKN